VRPRGASGGVGLRLILRGRRADADRVLRGKSRFTRALLAGLTWLAFLGAAAVASADNNVTYQGGPVAHSMTGVVVDWGSGINPMYTNETSGDPGLIKYLAAQSGTTTDIGGVTAQYMDASDHNAANLASYGQQYAITPSVTSTTIMDSQIQTELVNQIGAGNLPRPAGDGLSTIYLVLFPSGDVECINASTCSANAPNQSDAVFCAYHSSTQLSDGTDVLYAVLPDNTSGPQSTECGQAPTLLDDETSYLSHEWEETITDPLGDAWWVNNASSPDDGNEVSDNCNQVMTTEGGWTVQQLWSNIDRNCMGSEPAYSAPTANFLAPDAAAPNQNVSFDASSSTDPAADSTAISGTSYAVPNGIASYAWNWGDGTSNTTTSPTATHAYAALGTYEVSLTVTDNLGFTSTVTKALAITANGVADPYAATGSATGVSTAGATLAGTVNSEDQSTQYEFVYGTSPAAMTSSTPETAGPPGQANTPVSATVSGLRPSTTYYYELELFAGGQTYYGGIQSFATNAAPPPPQTPVAGTGGASAISPISAIISGTLDPGGSQPVSYKFSYGTSPADLGSSTAAGSGLTGTSSVPVSSILSGLAPSTTYYFRLDATLAGQTYSGSVQSFTTRAGAPGVSTGRASAITGDGATVSGSVSPQGAATSYLVEYGRTTAYGHSTPEFSAGAGRASVAVKATLSGLRSRTRYHYRLVAISAGGTTVGGDRTFRTAAPLAPAPRLRFTVSGGRRLALRFHCSKACTAHFTVTLAATGIIRFAPVTVALAHVSRSLRSRGAGTVTIARNAAIRARLRAGSTALVVVGYAVSRHSARSAPQAKRVTLRR